MIIALWADSKLLGIRCAKVEYGVDMVEELLQGYAYHGRDGRLLRCLVEGEVSENDACVMCQCTLDICNAFEVTV